MESACPIHPVIDKMIARRNKEFSRKSQTGRAVAIAAEAIWQITSERFMPRHLCYFVARGRVGQNPGYCLGCAIGALFAGLIDGHIATALRTEDSASACDEEIVVSLKDAFSPQMLHNIEAAFEGNNIAGTASEASLKWHDRRRALGDPGATELQLRILTNIIHNKGKFTPTNDPTDARHNAIIAKYGVKRKAKKALVKT